MIRDKDRLGWCQADRPLHQALGVPRPDMHMLVLPAVLAGCSLKHLYFAERMKDTRILDGILFNSSSEVKF